MLLYHITVGVVTGLVAGDTEVGMSVWRNFLTYKKVQANFGPTQLPPEWVTGVFPGC